MPEFEVGDRVTIVGGYDDEKVGYSGEVTKVDYCPDHGTETTFYEVKMDPDAPGPSAFVEDLTEEELEHETKEPKYRERQRVRILNPDHAHYGKTGVVTLWDRHCSDNSVWYEIRFDEPVGSLHYVQYLDEDDIEVYGLQPVSDASFKVDDRIVVLDNDVAPFHRDSGRHGVYEGDTLIADRGWIRLDGDKESKIFRFEFLKLEEPETAFQFKYGDHVIVERRPGQPEYGIVDNYPEENEYGPGFISVVGDGSDVYWHNKQIGLFNSERVKLNPVQPKFKNGLEVGFNKGPFFGRKAKVLNNTRLLYGNGLPEKREQDSNYGYEVVFEDGSKADVSENDMYDYNAEFTAKNSVTVEWAAEAEIWHGDDANAHKEFGTMVCDQSDRYWVSFGEDVWFEVASAYVQGPQRFTGELGPVEVISKPIYNGANK